MGWQSEQNARLAKQAKRNRRRYEEGLLRGDVREEFVERCLMHLKETGKITKYIRTRKNSGLDRSGRDFIYYLSRTLFDNTKDRECHLDSKSSIRGLVSRNEFVLRFIPEVTKPLAEEAERLFRASIEHVEKVRRILEERKKRNPASLPLTN